MTEMKLEAERQFDDLYKAGMEAKNSSLHVDARDYFMQAVGAAESAGDDQRRLHALIPLARAMWTLGEYEPASKQIKLARSIAEELGLEDEAAIATSNLGRLAAVQVVRTGPVVKEIPGTLRALAVPYFEAAYDALKDHPHLYYRYANATHGSVTAALAGNKDFAHVLFQEGMHVSDQISPEPYDQMTPAEISPGGLKQLKVARFLIPLGNRTPFLARSARQNLIR